MRFHPVAVFGIFVGWLLLFPLAGVPVPGAGLVSPLAAFLLPHASALVLLGRFCPSGRFMALAPPAILLTLGLTILYPLVPSAAPLLIPVVGGASAFLSIKACATLRHGDKPLLQAGLGLLLGNLLLLCGLFSPLSVETTFVLLGLLLVVPLLTSAHIPLESPPNQGLFRYLPLVFVFHLASGIMYGGIMPAFAERGFGQGGELLFYILAVAAGSLLLQKNREYLLASGILLAMFSFSCFLGQSPWAITLSMYLMQAAAGCIDIFVLSYLLSFKNLLEAFGIGNGAVCLSIFFGHQLAVWIGAPPTLLVMVGCLVLTCSVLVLYFLGRQAPPDKSDRLDGQAAISDGTEALRPWETAAQPLRLEPFRALLSGREWEVFCSILEGKTYKVAAAELQLAESTVKTYVRRICDKFDVATKKELLKKVLEG